MVLFPHSTAAPKEEAPVTPKRPDAPDSQPQAWVLVQEELLTEPELGSWLPSAKRRLR